MTDPRRTASPDVTKVALLADPDSPTAVAHRLAAVLPDRLADRSDGGRRFDVTVVSEPFSSGTEDPPTLMRRIADRADDSYDVVVALTDLPLHADGRKLMLEVSQEDGAALLSLPALGGLRLDTRTRRTVEDVVSDLAGAPSPPAAAAREEDPDLRFVATGPRGHLRVLAGMVRANRPWLLVPGLSRALAAALATGAIATVNATVWSLSDALGVVRLVIATIGSIGLMIGWLIVDANLWHRPSGGSALERQKAQLYNASTVITVGIGVVVCYAALFVINLVWGMFILNAGVWSSMTGTSLHTSSYLALAWLVASVATVGGALGSGFEGDDAVRAAAYSRREQERRQALQSDRSSPSAQPAGASVNGRAGDD